MRKFVASKILTFIALASFISASATEGSTVDAHSPEGTREEIKEFIAHHLQDSYDFNLLSYTDENGEVKHVGLPLPIILWDNGLHVFLSSKFHHGETVAHSGDEYYVLFHNKIYNTEDGNGALYDEEGELIDFRDQHEKRHATNAKPLNLSITKSVVMMLITGLLLLWIFSSLARSYAKNGAIPQGIGRFFEPIVLYIRDDIAISNIGEKKYKRYMPFLLTTFFFIWFLNMFGLTPLGVNVTGNIAVTSALAVLVFLITNLTGTKDYWKHIFDPLGDGMPWYGKIVIYIILVPIEILGIFIKPFALLIRLYANMTAGHVVMMSLIGLIFIFKSWVGGTLSLGLSFAISVIEVLVALLQAYIFTMLAALYFGFASEEHHHEHDEEHDHELVKS